jgi:biotin carboxyl carrier protein
MPGQVAAVQVREGDVVEAGQVLLLLEAMKMEIRVQAPRPGRVARVLARLGDTVQRDQALVELEAATEQHK